MNERIREIAKQANDYANYYAMLSDESERKIFEQKFAELIVRECADFVGSGEFGDLGMAKELKKYFGVEQ